MKRLLKELDFIVPYEVIFYIGEGKDGERLAKVADVKDSKNKKESIKCDFGSSFKLKKEVTLRNEGFKLEYVPEDEMYGNISIKLTKDGVDDEFWFHLERSDFSRLFRSCPWMIDGKLGDSFCIKLGKDKGSRGYPYFVSERESDILDFKEAGRIMNQEHQTSSWIPGHVYLLKDNRQFIYLGEINDPIRMGSYWGSRGCSAHTSLYYTGWSPTLNKLNGTYKYGLLVDGDKYDSLNDLGGLSIPEAVYKMLSPGKLNKDLEPWLLEVSAKTGYDLGEFIRQVDGDTRSILEVLEDTAKDIIKDQKKLKDTDFEDLSVLLRGEVVKNSALRDEFEEFVLQEFNRGLISYKNGYGDDCKLKPSIEKVLSYATISNAPYNFPDDVLKTYHSVVGSFSEYMEKEIKKIVDKVYDKTI